MQQCTLPLWASNVPLWSGPKTKCALCQPFALWLLLATTWNAWLGKASLCFLMLWISLCITPLNKFLENTGMQLAADHVHLIVIVQQASAVAPQLCPLVITHAQYKVKLIVFAFEHRLLWGYMQRGKNQRFSWLLNMTGSKRRLDRPFLWWSVKLFTTNQCYATTTHSTQNSNANTIDWYSQFQFCLITALYLWPRLLARTSCGWSFMKTLSSPEALCGSYLQNTVYVKISESVDSMCRDCSGLAQ